MPKLVVIVAGLEENFLGWEGKWNTEQRWKESENLRAVWWP